MQLADFDPIDPGESERFAFDFTNALSTGETPLSTAWSIQVVVGSDSAAASRLIGTASLSGNVSSQKIGNCQAGVKYLVVANVTTSAGDVLSLWSKLACNRFA